MKITMKTPNPSEKEMAITIRINEFALELNQGYKGNPFQIGEIDFENRSFTLTNEVTNSLVRFNYTTLGEFNPSYAESLGLEAVIALGESKDSDTVILAEKDIADTYVSMLAPF